MKKIMLSLLLLTLLAGCSEKEEVVVPYAPGAWDGAVHSSDYLGFSYTMPEGWTHATDEELVAMDAQADETLRAQMGDKADELTEQTYHYALSAKSEDEAQGVMILAQRYVTTVQTYVKAIQNGADAEGSGFTVARTYQQTLGGTECTVLPITLEESGQLQRQYVRVSDGYLINVMLFATDEAQFAAMEAAFAPIVK